MRGFFVFGILGLRLRMAENRSVFQDGSFNFVIIGKMAKRFNFGGLGIADERKLQTVEGGDPSESSTTRLRRARARRSAVKLIAAVNAVISLIEAIKAKNTLRGVFWFNMREERFELPEKGVRLQGQGERERAGQQ
jgi:hypothetical protein